MRLYFSGCVFDPNLKMPLFGGKKDSSKKRKEGKEEKSPSVEDKYTMKEMLGT